MDYVLADLLREVPDELFFKDGRPDFNRIFVEVARRIYREDGDEFFSPVHGFLTGKLPNLSTFQKSVTVERKQRE